jgi:mannose-6-phosphate isomerase-like protein (cupin superfamily)
MCDKEVSGYKLAVKLKYGRFYIVIKKIPQYCNYEDERGRITGIINSGSWGEINFISSFAGTIRGGHYHKYTQEVFFILEGEVKVVIEDLTLSNPITEEEFVKEGDIFIIEPFIKHTLTIIRDAKWINILSHKMSEENKDIYIQ